MGVLAKLSAAILSFTLPIFSIFSRSRPPTNPQIERLQTYLRIRTDHGNPDYAAASDFLNTTFANLLPTAKITLNEFIAGKPVFLASITGKYPNMPSLLLNSHTDVVPAEKDKWTLDPFAAQLAFVEGEWRLYARGSQDMKSVGMQYVEALSQLLKEGWVPETNVHLSYVPDEEVGGMDGMNMFTRSTTFFRLKLGVVLDEGLPNPGKQFNVYYGERQTWWLAIRVEGTPGHGATMPELTAMQVAHGIVNKALEFRNRELEKLKAGKDIGEVTGVNVVYMKSGKEDESQPNKFIMNVIPSTVQIGLDIRVPPTVCRADIDAEVLSWMTCDDGEICPGTTYEWVIKVDVPLTTGLNLRENEYYPMFLNGMESAGIADRYRFGIFPAATDARYLRMHNIPCFGFSPIENTPDLLHKHNEYITINGYLAGIKIYKELIKHLAGPITTSTPTPSPCPSTCPSPCPSPQLESTPQQASVPDEAVVFVESKNPKQEEDSDLLASPSESASTADENKEDKPSEASDPEVQVAEDISSEQDPIVQSVDSEAPGEDSSDHSNDGSQIKTEL